METLKQKLNARKTVLGTMLSEVANPNMARIMKAAGFELIVNTETLIFPSLQPLLRSAMVSDFRCWFESLKSVGNGLQKLSI